MAITATDIIRVRLLGSGRHLHPRQGASLLELVSVLTDSRWTDRPAAVHPVLAEVAACVNDLISAGGCRALVPYAPWLCADHCDRAVRASAIVLGCANAAIPHTTGRTRDGLLRAVDRAGENLAGRRTADRRRPFEWWHQERSIREACALVRRAIRTTAAALPAGPKRDRVLVALLESCINAARAVGGAGPVHPRLPVERCPDHIDLLIRWTHHPRTGERTRFYRPVYPTWVHHLVTVSFPDGAVPVRGSATGHRGRSGNGCCGGTAGPRPVEGEN